MKIDARLSKFIARAIVQVLAFGIFVYQMQHSINKFVEKPIVQVSSTTSISNIKMPVIYVCQDAQFDYALSNFYGYGYMNVFYSGWLSETSKISWRGKYNNMTFSDLFLKVFPHDSTSFNAGANNPEDSENYEWKKLMAVRESINPYGSCMKFTQSFGATYFSTLKKSIFRIVDPQADNPFVITSMQNGYGELGPTGNGSYDHYSYAMDITLHDSSLLVGQACANYGDSGYKACTLRTAEERFMKWLGCLPPWFPANTSLICDNTPEINVTKQSIIEMFREVDRLEIGQRFKFDSCLPPCLTMSIEMQQLKHITNLPNSAVVRINVDNKNVKVLTLAYAYDEFNLVVDVGSALGLWFGLSAISIYDSIIEVILTIFKKRYD